MKKNDVSMCVHLFIYVLIKKPIHFEYFWVFGDSDNKGVLAAM